MEEYVYRVMLLDDEYPVRRLLRECVDWASLGACVCQEAENAAQARALLERSVPDMIFVDINLPVENGIEFSRKILGEYPSVQVIIVTGYEEFNYVQECLRIGVADFITKPIDPEEITEAVKKVIERVRRRRFHHEEYEAARERLKESTQVSRENFVRQLLQGLVTSEIIYMQDRDLRDWMAEDIFQAALFLFSRDISPSLRELFRERVRGEKGLLCTFPDNRRLALVSNRMGEDMGEVIERVTEGTGQVFRAGIGCARSGINGAGLSAEEALTALHTAGEQEVVHYISLEDAALEDTRLRARRDLRTVCQYIRTGHTKEAVGLIRQELERHSSILELNLCRESAVEIVSALIELLREKNLEEKILFSGEDAPLKKIFQTTSCPELVRYMETLVRAACQAIRGMDGSGVVEGICRYLERNYHDTSLTLQKIAEVFHMNYSYLSRLFKEEMGVNFSEYLTGIRVGEAKRLLQESDLKIWEIAENVGFSDPHYLEVCFKRINHISMSRYRQRHRKPRE